MAESVGYQRTAYSTLLYIIIITTTIVAIIVLMFLYICQFDAVLGKVEGEGKSWHGHVTAVTVSPTYRKQGIARQLMDTLEDVTANRHDGYFVDLFVRASNKAAISMYEKV